MSEPQRTQDERIMSALSHGSIVLFGTGVIAAIVIWVTQKEKSAYIAFQALQATVYQLIGLVVVMLGWCCWTALYFLSMIPLIAAADSGGDPPAVFWLSLMLMFVPLAVMGLWVLGGLWGAVRTLQGRDFRYLILGDQVERWLNQ